MTTKTKDRIVGWVLGLVLVVMGISVIVWGFHLNTFALRVFAVMCGAIYTITGIRCIAVS